MEPEVAEMNMLRGSLGVMWMIGSGMSPSEEHRRIWGKKKKRPDRDGLDMSRGETVTI